MSDVQEINRQLQALQGETRVLQERLGRTFDTEAHTTIWTRLADIRRQARSLLLKRDRIERPRIYR